MPFSHRPNWLQYLSRKFEAASGHFGSWTIQSENTSRSFISYGSTHERLRFSRLYLQATSTRQKFSLKHPQPEYDRLLQQTKLFGLTVLTSKPRQTIAAHVLQIPKFVPLQIVIPPDLNEFIHELPSDRRQLLRRLAASPLRAEFSKSLAFITQFHRTFHLPTIRNAHGAEGFVITPKNIKREILEHNAEFLQIFHGDQCIAAGLCKQTGHTYRLLKTGWLHGSKSILKEGVQAFRIWTAIQRANKLGCSILDLGSSPPFLNDGVFHYKMRWNASIPNEFGQFGSHSLLIDPSHPDVQSFFTRQPTIIIDREGILGVCSTSHPASLNIKHALRQSINRYWRLAPPLEAHHKNLELSPTPKINSGWFIEEPWE